MWPLALTTLLLLASQPTAGHYNDVTRSIRGAYNVERDMRKRAEAIVEGKLQRRQAATTTATSMNATQWDAQTTTACTSSLMMLNGVASNPAGMAVCYNLPNLDNITGIFQADLRLYMISNPTGDFAGIPPQNVSVNLEYFGASVQSIPTSALSARDVDEPSLRSRAGSAPSLVQPYAFEGKINKDLMVPNMNLTTLQSLVTPVVTLSAHTASGTVVNTTLSFSEASFLTGTFSKQASNTAMAPTSASASASASTSTPATVSAVAASTTPFTLPGTKIVIFPIGAIITGVWALLGVSTVAWGTIERIQWRHQYRSRVKRSEVKTGQI